MARKISILCVFMILLAVITTSVSYAGKAVRMLIGNKSVDIKGITPAVMKDQVFVQVRPMAEAMGATLSWDNSKRELTVKSRSGTGIIRLGNRVGTIKGTKVYFPYAPYMYGNSVYAPDLFFNQLFNMVLIWDPYRQMYRWEPIVPPGPGVYGPPMIIYGPGSQESQPPYYYQPQARAETEAAPVAPTKTIVGEVLGVRPSKAHPQITVRAAGSTGVYAVAPDAVILRGIVGGRSSEISLGGVRQGDRATIRISQAGVVTYIRAQYNMAKGKVQSISGGSILLDSGVTLKVNADTEVVLPSNVTGTLQDVKVNDMVTASMSPVTGRTTILRVLPVPASAQKTANTEPGQLTLNTHGPLRVGDTLIATFKAQAGGQALLTIPGVMDNIPMTEIEPGTYQGQYTVQTGDVLMRQPVVVTFNAATGETYKKLSQMPVTIETVAGYLPRITYPRQGQLIISPVVVRGIARPGTIVRVSITYRANLYRILPMEGVTAVEDILVPESGQWETPPLSAVVPFDEDSPDLLPNEELFGVFEGLFRVEQQAPTIYTVTASSLGANGVPTASYSVEVNKKPGRQVLR